MVSCSTSFDFPAALPIIFTCVNNRFAPLIECGTLRQMLRKESTIGVKEKVLDVISFLVLSTRFLQALRNFNNLNVTSR